MQDFGKRRRTNPSFQWSSRRGRRCRETPSICKTPKAVIPMPRAMRSAAVGREPSRHRGIGQEDRVLVMMPVSVEAVFAWLGLGWIGAVETPINYEYKGAMLDYIIKDSGARLLVVHAKYLDLIRTASDGLDALETIVMVGDDGTTDTSGLGGAKVIALDDFLQAGPEPEAPVRPRLSDLATIMYTSGTTGPSKGGHGVLGTGVGMLYLDHPARQPRRDGQLLQPLPAVPYRREALDLHDGACRRACRPARQVQHHGILEGRQRLRMHRRDPFSARWRISSTASPRHPRTRRTR